MAKRDFDNPNDGASNDGSQDAADLLGYLFGALDETERQRLEERLAREPELREELSRLEQCARPLEEDAVPLAPPPGLARRARRYVALRARRLASHPSLASAAEGWSWRDIVVAVVVLVAFSLVLFPAVSYSRFHAEINACQHNLRLLGDSLALYSESSGGCLPEVPESGPLSTAGAYAPLLADRQLLGEPDWLICPGAGRDGMRDGDPIRLVRLDELRSAPPEELRRLHWIAGGDYGYGFGFFGPQTQSYHPRRRCGEDLAVLADSPRRDLSGRAGANHGKYGFNVLYGSGRVRWVRLCEPGGLCDNLFLNDDGDVAAGKHEADAVIAPSHASPLPRWVRLSQ